MRLVVFGGSIGFGIFIRKGRGFKVRFGGVKDSWEGCECLLSCL